MFLDANAPKLKFKSKPWITLSLIKSIPVKNKLLKSFFNKKDSILKEEFHTNNKKYRNLLSTLMNNIKNIIGILLRTHGKESNPLFLEKL